MKYLSTIYRQKIGTYEASFDCSLVVGKMDVFHQSYQISVALSSLKVSEFNMHTYNDIPVRSQRQLARQMASHSIVKQSFKSYSKLLQH